MAKKNPKPATVANRLHDLYESLQEQLQVQLKANRKANKNAEAKGDASENVWVKLLNDHLPHRYRVTKGFVIDADGQVSRFIDVVIHDRQFTPLIFNRDGNSYIPAESVYALFEVKQALTKNDFEYAGKMAASVRKLRRTSFNIKHAGGELGPVDLFPIQAGILTYTSTWKPPFGSPFMKAVTSASASRRLDFGVVASSGFFEVDYSGARPKVTTYSKDQVLAAFVMRLLARLQRLGTVPAIDYREYSRLLRARNR